MTHSLPWAVVRRVHLPLTTVHAPGSVRLAPAGVGCLCGIRTEVVTHHAFPLVTGLQPKDCKSIAKASKVRILHLPPRAEMAPDQRKRWSGVLLVYLIGVSKRPVLATILVLRPQACDLRKRVNQPGRCRSPWGIREEVWARATVLAGLPSRLTCRYARGVVAMTADVQAIAIEQRWSGSGLSRDLR